MRAPGAALLVGLALLLLELPMAHGLALFHSMDNNGSLCSQPKPMQITYFNNAASSDSYQVPLSAEAWNDAPVMIHLSSTSSLGSATIIVNSTNSPNFDFYGITYNAQNATGFNLLCSGGHIHIPIAITVDDSNLASFDGAHPSLSDNDVRVHNLAHEMGHAIGLFHSQVVCSLMYPYMDTSIPNCGVYFPVVDDVKSAAMLYGWAFDSSFASQSTSSNGKVSWEGNGICVTCPPVDLQVLSPSTSSATVYNNSHLRTLPS